MFEQKYIYLILAPDLPELFFTLQIIWFTFSSEPCICFSLHGLFFSAFLGNLHLTVSLVSLKVRSMHEARSKALEVHWVGS